MTEVADSFNTALHQDAERKASDDAPQPPPRKPQADPDAPHGRDEQGVPRAPYGTGRNGKPRIKPAGPGRGKHETSPAADPAPALPVAAEGYAAQLTELGMAVWLGASGMRGGKLLGIKIPDTRPYALVWHQELPRQVAAWNAAARSNATVRGWVTKLSGEGSWSWVIGVAIASASLAGSCAELARATPDVRAEAAAANDAEVEMFIKSQLAAARVSLDEQAVAA